MKSNVKKNRNARLGFLFGILLFTVSAAHAQDWCQLLPGWQVVTHGTRAENVFILGQLQGAPGAIWIQISSAEVGKANVAMAMGAQLAGKTISFWFTSPSYTCASFPSWAPMGEITHVMLNN